MRFAPPGPAMVREPRAIGTANSFPATAIVRPSRLNATPATSDPGVPVKATDVCEPRSRSTTDSTLSAMRTRFLYTAMLAGAITSVLMTRAAGTGAAVAGPGTAVADTIRTADRAAVEPIRLERM